MATVRLYTLWRLYLGIDRLSLDADNVQEVVDYLEEKFGAQLREQLQAHGMRADRKIQDYSLLLLNGYNVNKQNLAETKLGPGDVLHVFPLAMGG